MNYMIAIVEDNPEEADLLKQHFKRYAASSTDTFKLSFFDDGNKFLNTYHPIYDLVMMDINLPQCNGMDIAVSLRKIDQSVALVFVTSMVQYAVKGYEVDALDFLLKPVNYQSFRLKIQRLVFHFQRRRSPDLLIALQDGMLRMPSNRVKYIEVNNHSLIYHTTEGNFQSRGKLSDLENRMSDTQFVRCNRCYLVNLAFVRTMRGSLLEVDTEELQISRSKKAIVLEALNNYLGGGI